LCTATLTLLLALSMAGSGGAEAYKWGWLCDMRGGKVGEEVGSELGSDNNKGAPPLLSGAPSEELCVLTGATADETDEETAALSLADEGEDRLLGLRAGVVPFTSVGIDTPVFMPLIIGIMGICGIWLVRAINACTARSVGAVAVVAEVEDEPAEPDEPAAAADCASSSMARKAALVLPASLLSESMLVSRGLKDSELGEVEGRLGLVEVAAVEDEESEEGSMMEERKEGGGTRGEGMELDDEEESMEPGCCC